MDESQRKRKGIFKVGLKNKYVKEINDNSDRVDSHPHFGLFDGKEKSLIELDITLLMTDILGGMVSNGVLFTLVDFMTIGLLSARNSSRQRTVSSQIDLKLFHNDKPRVGETMFIVTKYESFSGIIGNATCYFYDRNYKIFAKGSQVVFYYPNKKIGEK